MSPAEILVLIVMAALGGGLLWSVRAPRRRLLTAEDPLLARLARDLEMDLLEDTLEGDRDGMPVSLRVSVDRRGPRVEAVAPIRGRMPVGFLVSRRDPRLQRGAPLGVPQLDRFLQVYTSDTRIPDDLSWLAGQNMLLDNLRTPGAVRFLSEVEVAEALGALLPTAREGSRVNAGAVSLIEDGDDAQTALRLLQDAVTLARAIERAADPWRPAAEQLALAAGPYDENGDRVLTGARDGLQVRAEIHTDEDGDITGVEVSVSPAPPDTRIRPGDGGIALHNPILDHRIQVETDTPDLLRERLNAPDGAADLLEVFGTWPGSALEDGVLHVRSLTMVDSDTLVAMIRAGLRCVRRVNG